MKRRVKYVPATILFAAMWILCLATFAQESSRPDDLNSAIESLRADLRADKVAIVTEAMQLNEKDSAVFWPIYKRYENELSKLNDERVQLIKSYSEKFNNMSDADAKNLAEKSFDYDSKLIDLKKKYFKEFNKQLPATTVAKFFQLEHRLDLLIDLKIAAGLPPLLAKPATSSNSPGLK